MNESKKPKTFWEKHGKTLGFWLLAFGIIATFFALTGPGDDKQKKDFRYTDFIQIVQEGKIENIIVEPQNAYYRVTGKFIDAMNQAGKIVKGTKFSYVFRNQAKFENLELEEFLNKCNIKFITKVKSDNLGGILGWVLIIGFFFLVMAFFQKKQKKIIDEQSNFKKTDSFTSANTKEKIGEKVTFANVAGLKEAKEELKEIIDFLKNPTHFSRLGGKVPRGVLIAGPTGSGKTLLARAVAGEANANFFSMAGSEFVEMFVGVGAGRVRDLFSRARKSPPAIIFIDEIDAVGRHRGAGLGGGHDEREQTLNQILVEMDGFEQHEGIIILAATNRPDMLDKAILRPGRFDRKVYTNLPDIEDREEIFKVHTKNKPLAKNVDLKVLARGTPMFSGADIANLVNEAALRAARKTKNEIEMEDMEWAKDKVLMGTEKKMIMSPEEKRIIAYHEVGHALVSLHLPNTDPLHKISIIPRGEALGITLQLPLADKHFYSKEDLETKLAIFMGGRAAEEIFFNQLTSGASNDIEVATGIAQKMVRDFGMSDLGPLSFGKKEGEIFLGRDFVQAQDYSEATAHKIDEEVKRLIDNAYQKAKEILEKHRDQAEKLVKLLLEKETLDGNEVKQLLNI